MNTKQFLALYGRDRAVKVAEDAGISYGYYLQYVSGVRRPSADMAIKLEEASDGDLDMVSMLKTKSKSAA